MQNLPHIGTHEYLAMLLHASTNTKGMDGNDTNGIDGSGRRSEQLDETIGQLELSLEELEAVRAERAALAATEGGERHETPVKRPARKPLPDHLPRETVEHAPMDCCCPDCGGALKKLGEDVSETLEYRPEHFKVIRYVRPKLACARCDTIVQAPAASRPIANRLAGPGLLAHVLTAKFCDHLPLYRQSGIYARSGVELERLTLADWVGQCSALLRPLVEALNRYVLSAARCTPTIRRCRSSRPERARRRPGGCGRTFGMIVRPVIPVRRRCGSPTRRTAGAIQTPAGAPEVFCRGSAGRCVCRLRRLVRRRQDSGGSLLGARKAQVL